VISAPSATRERRVNILCRSTWDRAGEENIAPRIERVRDWSAVLGAGKESQVMNISFIRELPLTKGPDSWPGGLFRRRNSKTSL